MSKYNISKTSRFLGISSELLRHYERLGLIEPERHKTAIAFSITGRSTSCRGSGAFATWAFPWRKSTG